MEEIFEVGEVINISDDEIEVIEIEDDEIINNNDFETKESDNDAINSGSDIESLAENSMISGMDSDIETSASKAHKNSKFKKPYSRAVPKYEKELNKALGLDVPINPFKRSLITDDVTLPISTKPNKLDLFKVLKKDNAGITALSPIKVEDDSDDGDDDGFPEKYTNLQSNAYINPFKYINTFSDSTTREAYTTKRPSTNWIQSLNESRIFGSKTLEFKRSNSNTYIKPCLKRRRTLDDNRWESGFTNFKKNKPAENEFQQQQMKFIQNLSEDGNIFNSLMGGNKGGNEGVLPTRNNKVHRVRSRIVSPYSRPNSPSTGMFRL